MNTTTNNTNSRNNKRYCSIYESLEESLKGGIKMVNNSYKSKAKALIEKAKQKGLVKTYSEFCETEISKKTTLSSEEVNYYASKRKGVKK